MATEERDNDRRPRSRRFRSGVSVLACAATALLPAVVAAGTAHAATLTPVVFAPHVDYTTGTRPRSVAVGDLNGDGRPDLATADFAAASVSVLLGNGDGTFRAHVDYPAGAGTRSVAVGDFNGDGKADLVAANADAGSVSVLLGNGDGTFAARVDYPTGPGPASVAVGDFNGDGKADLVTADAAVGADSVSVLLGNGDGTFAARVDYPTGAGPLLVAVGDFNGDGKADLATANATARSVSVLLGNGDGTFAARVDYPTGIGPASVAVGDFNGDGRADLATANPGAASVSVLLGNGDGTFAAPVDYPTGSGPLSVAVGDFNADGKTDLATADFGAASASVLLGNGDGTFGAHADYPTGTGPALVAVGDFNGDGRPDLTTANDSAAASTVSVLLNQGVQSLSVVKESVQAVFTGEGQALTYAYRVKNTGTARLTGLTVSDSLPGVRDLGCGTDQLDPGASTTCYGGYTTTAADVTAKQVVDTATATATGPGNPVPVTATSAQVTVPLAALSVTKAADPTRFTGPGQTVNYTFTVTNTGMTGLADLAVTDSGPGTPAVSCPQDALRPGGRVVCTASYTTTAADVAAGKIVDRAEATAHVSIGDRVLPVLVTAASRTVTVPFAGLTVAKTVVESAYSAKGQTLHYRYTVTNNGNVPLTGLAVTDDGPGKPAVTCRATALAPGASTVCTASYVTTRKDVKTGRITNTAVATATADGTAVTATSNTVTVLACAPCADKDHGGCKGSRPEGLRH